MACCDCHRSSVPCDCSAHTCCPCGAACWSVCWHLPAVGLSGHRIPDAAAGGTFFAATKFAVRALTEGLRQEVRGLADDADQLTRQLRRKGSNSGCWGRNQSLVLATRACSAWPFVGVSVSGATCAVAAAASAVQARSKKLPLRVSGISPGLVETNFFAVRAFGDEEAARAVTSSMQCLQPSDIAEAVVWCLAAPQHMEVDDVVIRPTEQLI